MNRSYFAEKTAIVTGGSSGIGKAVVIALAEAGCRVWFCSRNPVEAGTFPPELAANLHHRICDITDPDACAVFVREVMEHEKKIDFLVNNAAYDGRVELQDADSDMFDRFVAVNLKAAVTMTRLAEEGLAKGQGKAVVNLGTTNWMLGLQPFTLYSAAKSGLVGFTRACARELGKKYGIRVNMVSPGWVMTEKQLKLYVTEQDKQDLLRDQSLEFLLQEEHITQPVLFMLSRASSAITGQNLVVDGGKLMQ